MNYLLKCHKTDLKRETFFFYFYLNYQNIVSLLLLKLSEDSKFKLSEDSNFFCLNYQKLVSLFLFTLSEDSKLIYA